MIIAALSGCLLAAGGFALVLIGVQPVPRLGDAFDSLAGRRPEPVSTDRGLGRLGGWLRRRTGLVVSDHTRRRLRLAGISVDRHIAHKAVGALAGLALPTAVGGGIAWLAGTVATLPALVGLGGAVIGFLLPDLILRRREQAVAEDATEALLAFLDLVTLERLANRSGSQALRAAAAVSNVMVFRAIAGALERARLEQRAPYGELQRLGEELELPALVDIADVMRLDESGAALSGALRARVKELRDAHLTAMKLQAAQTSERLGVLMVVPTLLFGLLFLVPPLLRLAEG